VRVALSAAGAAVALVVLFASAAPAAPTTRSTVFAASSLAASFPRIDGAARYSFGGSNQLALQIREGAPADVFASASPEYTRTLFRSHLVEAPVAFATNALVLAVPADNPAGIGAVADLRRRGSVKLIVGTPQVPVGAYTRVVLRRLGLLSVLAKVVSQEPDVKSIVAKLSLGEADAGFVYRTDVRASAGRLRAILIPARAQPNVRYEAAVVRSSNAKASARRWVARLRGARAQRVLRAAGFGPP